jgi:hypothetical protein
MTESEKYQILWELCEELVKQLRATHNIVEALEHMKKQYYLSYLAED